MAPVQRVIVGRDFTQPPEAVFAYMAVHENLEPLLGAKVRRRREGTDGDPNGAGSVRELKVGPLPPFEETVTEFVPNELIRYVITKGSPLRGHHGEMRVTPTPTGSHLHYEITFGSTIPGLALIV